MSITASNGTVGDYISDGDALIDPATELAGAFLEVEIAGVNSGPARFGKASPEDLATYLAAQGLLGGSGGPALSAYQLTEASYYASSALLAVVPKLVWLSPINGATTPVVATVSGALLTTNRPLDGSTLAYQEAAGKVFPVPINQQGPYIEVALTDTVPMLAADPPVVRWALYAIAGDWNAAGTDSTVYVPGLTDRQWASTGWVLDSNGKPLAVEVGVAAGTWAVDVPDPLASLYSGSRRAAAYADAAQALNDVDGNILRFNYSEASLSAPASPGAGVVYGQGLILSLNGFPLSATGTLLHDLRIAGDANDQLVIAGDVKWTSENVGQDFIGTVTLANGANLVLEGPSLHIATILLATGGAATISLYGLTPDLPAVPAGVTVVDKRYKLIATGGGSSTPLGDVYGASQAKRNQVFGLFTTNMQYYAADLALPGDTSTFIGSVIFDRPNGVRYELAPDVSTPIRDSSGNVILDAQGNPTATPTWYRQALP